MQSELLFDFYPDMRQLTRFATRVLEKIRLSQPFEQRHLNGRLTNGHSKAFQRCADIPKVFDRFFERNNRFYFFCFFLNRLIAPTSPDVSSVEINRTRSAKEPRLNIRHWQPVRTTYRSALMICHISHVRGRPMRCTGKKSSISFHSSRTSPSCRSQGSA